VSSKKKDLTSHELIARIGLTAENAHGLLGDESLDDLRGDLGAALRERYDSFTNRHEFAPGDLVTWKVGMRNKRIPRYGQPAVVIERLAKAVRDGERDAGSPYFQEPLDVVLGVICDEAPLRGEFLCFAYDSRRFRFWTEE